MVKRHAAAAEVFHTHGTEIRHLQNAGGQLLPSSALTGILISHRS